MNDSESEPVGGKPQIAPLKLEMISRHRQHFDDVSRMKLDPVRVVQFKITCRGEGLQENAIESLLIIVKELIHYRQNRSSVVLSGHELNKAITKVSNAAGALVGAINDLVAVDFPEILAIERLMNLQGEVHLNEGDADYVKYVDLLQFVGLLMWHTASEYVKLPPNAARDKSNKPPTLSREVVILQRAHKIVAQLGHTFRIYKGGSFHRVCDALYEAAEMPQGSGAEGAITKMMRARAGAGRKEKLQHLKQAKGGNSKP